MSTITTIKPTSNNSGVSDVVFEHNVNVQQATSSVYNHPVVASSSSPQKNTSAKVSSASDSRFNKGGVVSEHNVLPSSSLSSRKISNHSISPETKQALANFVFYASMTVLAL